MTRKKTKYQDVEIFKNWKNSICELGQHTEGTGFGFEERLRFFVSLVRPGRFREFHLQTGGKLIYFRIPTEEHYCDG